jgi:simple sugar transport system substrate-binding protein
VKLAAADLGISDKLKIYSADISTADIQEITEEGSPWVATAATNPAVVGAVSIRAAALQIAGEEVPSRVVVEPVLVTQKQLRDAQVKTIDELAAKIPSFSTSTAVTATWIPSF